MSIRQAQGEDVVNATALEYQDEDVLGQGREAHMRRDGCKMVCSEIES